MIPNTQHLPCPCLQRLSSVHEGLGLVVRSYLTSHPRFPNPTAHPCPTTHLFHQTHCEAEVVPVMVGGRAVSPARPRVVGHPLHSPDRAQGTTASPCSLDIHLCPIRGRKSMSLHPGQTPPGSHRTACPQRGTLPSHCLLSACAACTKAQWLHCSLTILTPEALGH